MLILGPLAAATISTVTETLASFFASVVTSSPSTRSTAGSWTLVPGSPSTRSIVTTSPTATFSWRPPVRTIAYTADLTLSIETGPRQSASIGAQKRGRHEPYRGSSIQDRSDYWSSRLPASGLARRSALPRRAQRSSVGRRVAEPAIDHWARHAKTRRPPHRKRSNDRSLGGRVRRGQPRPA